MLSRPLQPYTRKRAPQNRWLQQFRGLPYVLEGNIGSGKTTLGRQLVLFCEARGLAASFLEEQFPKDLLQQFIRHGKEHPGERNPYAAPFQMQVLECRAATYREADALCARGHVVFIDRSLPGDVVFAALNKALGHFTTEEWRAYEVRVHECDLLEPAALIYLATSVTECLARIAMRRREGEDAYTAEYLQGARTHDTYSCMRC